MKKIDVIPDFSNGSIICSLMWEHFAHCTICATVQILLKRLDFFEAVFTQNLFMLLSLQKKESLRETNQNDSCDPEY